MKEFWKPVTKLMRFDSSYNIVDIIEIRSGYYVSSKGRLKYKGRIRKISQSQKDIYKIFFLG